MSRSTLSKRFLTTHIGTSFIDKARTDGTKALLGEFLVNNGKFDQCLKGMRVEKMEDNGNVTCKFDVTHHFQNGYGTLHGGAIATIVDVVGTLSILAVDHTKPGVSVEINVSYVGAAPGESCVTVEGKLLKLGKRLAYTQIDLYNAKGNVIATGRHTKFVG